jgi:hypothetical protein
MRSAHLSRRRMLATQKIVMNGPDAARVRVVTGALKWKRRWRLEHFLNPDRK